MAETLGSLCDKLTIVKLKEYHTEDKEKLSSLQSQSQRLQAEINQFVSAAVNGSIPLNQLTFAANKVFKKEGNEVLEVTGNMGEVFSQLADVNCMLWHEVEKGYDIDNVPQEDKDNLVKKLAVLNLERNKCIDQIDIIFKTTLEEKGV